MKEKKPELRDIVRWIRLGFMAVAAVVFLVLYISASKTLYFDYDGYLLEVNEQDGVIEYTGKIDGARITFTADMVNRMVSIVADEKKLGPYRVMTDPYDISKKEGEEEKFKFYLSEGENVIYAADVNAVWGVSADFRRTDGPKYSGKPEWTLNRNGLVTVTNGEQFVYIGPEPKCMFEMLFDNKATSTVWWGLYVFGLILFAAGAGTLLIREKWYNLKHPVPITYRDEWYNKTDPVANVKYSPEFKDSDYNEAKPSKTFVVLNTILALVFAFAGVIVLILGAV